MLEEEVEETNNRCSELARVVEIIVEENEELRRELISIKEKNRNIHELKAQALSRKVNEMAKLAETVDSLVAKRM